MKIDVVMPVLIVSQESLTLTEAAINSLGDVNLIIVDDASPFGGGFLRSKADTYVRNKERSRFAGSVNKGLKLAGDGLIAVVNNDIRVSPNWQEVVTGVFRDDTFSVHLRMTDYGVPFAYGDETTYEGRERWCQASFFVIDGKKKQLFDENFKHSYDDWEYFFRARKNWKTAYTNRACFQHEHSFTRRQMANFQQEEQGDREYFKSLYGDYAENLFAKQFPDQMQRDWKSGFDL